MSRAARSPRIFLSYRHADTTHAAIRLYDRLAEAFGRDGVFMDVESIQPGADFAETIRAAVESCDVVLVVIGDRWLTVPDGVNRRRLDDPNDSVRLEVESALRSGVRVVPVLIDDASMPAVEDFPVALRDLAGRQAFVLQHREFARDAGLLVEELKRLPRHGVPVGAATAPPPVTVEPGPARVVELDVSAAPRRPAPLPRPPSVPADVNTLAALLSPASRVEPELLRAVRLECLPELPVDAEQELWFGPLVDARSDGGITFAPEELRVLRARLRALHDADGRALVERVREVLDEVHAGISPLLRLEEELAWHEVVGDAAGAVAAADLAVRAVAARRDGAVHWVERVWSTLPESVRSTPTGWVLGQVAGARDLPDAPRTLADHEAAALLSAVPAARLLLCRNGGVLALGVPEGEADTSIDLPDTWPRVVEVIVGDAAPRRVLIDDGTAAELEVGDVPVRLRTLAGDVYAVDDPRRELLDSVLLGPDGAWCVTRVGADSAVLGTAGDFAAALADLGPARAPLDLARSLGRVAPESVGQLFALTFDSMRPSVAPPDMPTPVTLAAMLPVRGRAEIEAGIVVRTLARGANGVEPVTLRAAESFESVLVALDAFGLDLVPGAPVVDDADRLVGVVAPPTWSAGPAAVRAVVLASALAVTPGQTPPSQELLVVVASGPGDPLPGGPFRLSGIRERDAVRAATSAWLLRRHPDGSAALVHRMHTLALTGNMLRRGVRLTDPEPLPPNDATGLMHALSAAEGTVRLLDEDEARLVAAFVAGLHQPAAVPARAAATAGGGRPAARVGDPTAHPGVVGPPGVATVLLGGLQAAVVGTPHACNFPPPAMHPPSVIVPPGSVTVLIGGMPAARVGDLAACGAPIVVGAPTVLIGG